MSIKTYIPRDSFYKEIDREDSGGWIFANETWVYASTDSPTFTFTIASDVTTKYSVGQRIKLTQTTVKYFIITAVSTFAGGNTTITVYGGTDYTLANAIITNPFWSMVKSPQGFPINPAKWTVTVSSTANDRQGSPVSGTWYNDASLQISIPIGVWHTSYTGSFSVTRAANGELYGASTLSTANNSESDTNWSDAIYTNNASALQIPVAITGVIVTAAKTTYYLNAKTDSTSITNVGFYGPSQPTIIRAVCSYL